MPNGKIGDNPLSDLVIHGVSSFPPDIEELLLAINSIGKSLGRYPLGENWPFSPKEFQWGKGKKLDEARELLAHYLEELKSGRGDDIMLNPLTREPISEG